MPKSRTLLIIITLAIIYFLSAKLGLKLAFVNASATAVWPPTGIAIASFLILGNRIWPAIFIGAFFANLTTQGTILTSLGIATGNTLEGLVGAYLVKKYANGRNAFNTPADIFAFAVLAGMVAPIVSATIGLASLFLGGLVQKSAVSYVWTTWWLGDASGALIVAPLILIWSNNYEMNWSPKKVAEAFILTVILTLLGIIVFGQLTNYPIDFIIFPVLLWVAFRFGIREVVTATTLLSTIAIWGTLSGRGPFARSSQNESLLLLQSFMAIVTISKSMVAALVAQGRQLDNLKDEFVSMASHEIRTPLAAIKGFLSMILAKAYGPIPPELRKPLANISLSTERLITLVNDLLDVSRLESGVLEPKITTFEASKIVTEILENMEPIASQKGLELINGLKASTKVKADENYLRQILQNLIGNAIKFTDSGSIKLKSKIDKKLLYILVSDTGEGISEADQAKIFDKFQQITSKKRGKPPGSGLGLFLSRQMALLMGGNLYLESSSVGGGSTFVLSLPVVA